LQDPALILQFPAWHEWTRRALARVGSSGR